MFVLIVVILILVCAVVLNGVSSFITTLFSSGITLPVFYSDNGGYDGLSVALNIKPDVCNLDGYSFNIYSLFI